MTNALFTLSIDGKLTLSGPETPANISGCYISSSNFSTETNLVSGYIEFPHPTKKELDTFGRVILERSVVESLSFFISDPDDALWDKFMEHINTGGFFCLNYEGFVPPKYFNLN